MIISKHGAAMRMVRQDDHMLQCRELADHWGNDRFDKLPRHESVCFAAAQHDWGWTEVDNRLPFLEEARKPVNFYEFSLEEHIEFYEKGYRAVLAQDKYAGLLIGMHWLGLYRSRYGYDPSLTIDIPDEKQDGLFALMTRLEKEFVDIKLSYWEVSQSRREFEDEIWMGYEFLQVIDRLSLFMSLGNPELPGETVLGPVRMKRNDAPTLLKVVAPGDGRLLLDPFPFSASFETKVLAKCIEDKPYESAGAYRELVHRTPKEDIHWRIAPGEGHG